MFGTVVSALGLTQSTLSVTDGHAVFTPSAELASLVSNSTPSQHQVTIDIPEITQSVAGIDVHAVIAHAQLDSISVGLGQSAVTADIALHGTIHLTASFPLPSADLVVDKATVHLEVGIANQKLSVTSAAATIQDHVENCSLGDSCDAALQEALPDLSGLISDRVETLGNSFLGDPAIFPALLHEIDQVVNLTTPASQPHWTVDPTSLTISGGAIRAEASRP
jgi:hypothetical protein